MPRARISKASGTSKQNSAKVSWALVLIDEAPIREDESRRCRRLMKTAEREREKIRRFNEQDSPDYQRWMATEFGALETELRETRAAHTEKAQLLEQIEMEMLWTQCSPYVAYRRVTERIQQAATFEQHAEEEASQSQQETEEEFERHVGNYDAFDHFLEDVAGVDPSRLSDADYEEMYDRYLDEMRRLFGIGPSPRTSNRRVFEKPKAEGSNESKCKELFRALVRRLHPDTRADGNATVGRLWHAVQEAWAARDLEKLQLLSSFTDVVHGSFLSSTIAELRRIACELDDDISNLRRELRRLRKRPEWGFSKLAPLRKEALADKMYQKLERELDEARSRLRVASAKLESWSRPDRMPEFHGF